MTISWKKWTDLVFRISPKSFFQTNTEQAAELYRLTLDFAGLRGTETVYDLYTGTGTIALFIARHCRKVIGMESVQEAIEDANINAGLNQISNVSFFAADIKDLLKPDFTEQHGSSRCIDHRSAAHRNACRRC